MPKITFLTALEGNRQRLDGGAMFGNAPREMWKNWSKPDECNRIDLACRSLLTKTDDGRTLLFEAGIGAFFDPKMKERFGVTPAHHMLLESLSKAGIREEEIDAYWSRRGVLCSDMETAALYTIGRLRGVRTMSILNNVVAYQSDTLDAIGSHRALRPRLPVTQWSVSKP